MYYSGLLCNYCMFQWHIWRHVPSSQAWGRDYHPTRFVKVPTRPRRATGNMKACVGKSLASYARNLIFSHPFHTISQICKVLYWYSYNCILLGLDKFRFRKFSVVICQIDTCGKLPNDKIYIVCEILRIDREAIDICDTLRLCIMVYLNILVCFKMSVSNYSVIGARYSNAQCSACLKLHAVIELQGTREITSTW